MLRTDDINSALVLFMAAVNMSRWAECQAKSKNTERTVLSDCQLSGNAKAFKEI